MKVSLYVRERGTRKQKKHNPKKSYLLDSSIIWVLRYGKAWETLDVKTLSNSIPRYWAGLTVSGRSQTADL